MRGGWQAGTVWCCNWTWAEQSPIDFYSLEGKWPFLPKALKATGNEGAFCVSEPHQEEPEPHSAFVATMLTAPPLQTPVTLPESPGNFSDERKWDKVRK